MSAALSLIEPVFRSALMDCGTKRASTDTGSVPVAKRFGASRTGLPFSLEWAAGFADGESCIHVARQTYRCGRSVTWRLRIQVYQNDYAVLEHFRDGLGVAAKIYKVKRTAQHNRQVYSLMYDGQKAKTVISLLTPFLIRKQAEAQTALAFWQDGLVGTHFGRKGMPPSIAALRERLYLKMRSLK